MYSCKSPQVANIIPIQHQFSWKIYNNEVDSGVVNILHRVQFSYINSQEESECLCKILKGKQNALWFVSKANLKRAEQTSQAGASNHRRTRTASKTTSRRQSSPSHRPLRLK